MASDLKFLDDGFLPISSLNLGAVDAGSSVVQRVNLGNEGTTGVTSATLGLSQVANSDGVNYASMAFDDGSNNPGAYQTVDKFIGNIDAGANVAIWVKVAPSGAATPAGNPRAFDISVTYTAT